jgi:hypothetical protein
VRRILRARRTRKSHFFSPRDPPTSAFQAASHPPENREKLLPFARGYGSPNLVHLVRVPVLNPSSGGLKATSVYPTVEPSRALLTNTKGNLIKPGRVGGVKCRCTLGWLLSQRSVWYPYYLIICLYDRRILFLSVYLITAYTSCLFMRKPRILCIC